MQITWKSILGSAVFIWFFVKQWTDKLSKIIEPLVAEAEQRAKDGLIDKADRKAIVMKAISLLEQDGKIKLNFISRIIVSKVVDRIASKLPDFNISIKAKETLSRSQLIK